MERRQGRVRGRLLQEHEPGRRGQRQQAGPQRQVVEPGLLPRLLLLPAQQGERGRGRPLQQQGGGVPGLQGRDLVFLQRLQDDGAAAQSPDQVQPACVSRVLGGAGLIAEALLPLNDAFRVPTL